MNDETPYLQVWKQHIIRIMDSKKDVNTNFTPNEVDTLKYELQALGYPKKKWSLRDFEIGRKIGKGHYGCVYIAREIKSKFIVALKVIKKKKLEEYHAERLIRSEIEIQANLHHKNILRLYGYFYDAKRIFLILEYSEKGEIYSELKERRRFSEKRAAFYISRIADAVDYCHQKHVIHRDIKPENILIGYDGEPKIADFGGSAHSPSNRRHTFFGTLDYIPPEMIDHKDYDSTVDNWCIGVLTYELLCGKPPFESSRREMTYELICKLDIRFPSYVSEEAQDFIRKLLVINPKDRMPLSEVNKHPWIIKNKNYTPTGSF